MDDFDFDFGDWLGDIDSGLDLSGGDTSWLDAIDWGSLMGDIDLSNIDLSGFDQETADSVYGGSDLGTGLTYYPGEGYGTGTAGGMGGAEGLIGDTNDIFGTNDGAGTIVITGEKDTDKKETDADTGKCPPGSEQVFKYKDGSTMTLDCKGNVIGSTPATVDPDDPEGCPPGSEQVFKYKDGSTMTLDCKGRVISSTPATVNPDDPEDCPPGSETSEKLADGSTVIKDCKGNIIRTIKPDDTKCPPNSNTTETLPDGTKVVKDCKGNIISTTKPTGPGDTKPPLQDWERLIALLGGILGLTNRKVDTPRTFTGTIPKYTATRGPARSPTEGGRRPGGAGIGSLTGGVTYTPVAPPVGAAYGGLMGLAAGGKTRPARYLRGGTDGMADKIQTDIDGKQSARLSHGEFVIPADVVSHLGNGNSDAGADVLYDMMAKVRKARTGTPQQGKQINPRKYLPK